MNDTLSRDTFIQRRSQIEEMLEQAAMSYAEFTEGTATYPRSFDPSCEATPGLVYAALGLANETGELAEHVDLTSNIATLPTKDAYEKVWHELGDCQWYVARVACEAPISLSFPAIVQHAAALYYGMDPQYREMLTATQLCAMLTAHQGRVTGVVKKMLRDGREWGVEKRHEKMSELQSHLVLYVARSFQFAMRTAPVVGIDGGYVGLLRANVNKLSGRKERGTLHGDGDVR